MAPSSVWTLVTKSMDGKSANCVKCNKRFSNPSTSTIRYHLKQVHFIVTPKNPSTSKKNRNQETVETGDDGSDADDPGPGGVSEQNKVAQEQAGGSSKLSSFEGPLDRCLSNSLAFSKGGHRDEQATDALLFMMVRDDMPLRTPEKEGFKTFCKALQPLYSVPSEPTCTKALERKFDEVKTSIGRELARTESIGITLDLWTHSETMQSYLGVTAHFKDGKNKLRCIELGVRHMPERKTTDNIAAGLLEMCAEWNIDIKSVKGVVTDGGANVKAAARQVFGAEKHVTCAGHSINSIGQAVLGMTVTSLPSEAEPDSQLAEPEDEDDAETLLADIEDEGEVQEELSVRSLLMEVKRIVRFFRCSEVASEELKKRQQTAGTPEAKCLKLVQEVRTRWNSTYAMLQRYLDLEEHVTAVLFKLQRERNATKRKPPAIIGAEKISILCEIRDLLRPLDDATKMLSTEKNVCLSNVIPIVYGLKTDIGNILITEPLAFNVKAKLLSEIELRFSGIELLHPYAAATILDPRYKKFVFENPRAAAFIISNLRDRVSQMVAESGRALEEQHAAADSAQGSSSGIWSAVDDLLRRSSLGALDQEAAGAVPSQLKAYLSSPVVDRRLNPDPMAVWHTMRVGNEQLYQLAMEYLPLMATSTASERLFSHAGSVKCTKRNRLSPKHLNMLVCLRSTSWEDWVRSRI